MRFGASVWPWKWDGPYDKAIARIGDAGFRATELIAWDDEALDEYFTPGTVKELRAILDDKGMALSQFVVKTPGLSSPDAAARAEAVEVFKRGADKGIELGAPIINTVVHYPLGIEMPRITDRPLVQQFTVEVPSGLDWRQNWRDYVEGLRACAEYAASVGVRYSLEPHPFRYGASSEGILRILEAVDSPALGVNFDPSHLFPSGDIPHVAIYRLGDAIVHCHFSDNDGETNVHWRPGMGKIDWERVLIALKETGFDGVISLEFEDVPGVSRGVKNVPGVYRHPEATAEFEQEYRTGSPTSPSREKGRLQGRVAPRPPGPTLPDQAAVTAGRVTTGAVVARLGVLSSEFDRPRLGEVLDAVADHGIGAVQFHLGSAVSGVPIGKALRYGLVVVGSDLDARLAGEIREEAASRALAMAAVDGTFNMADPSRGRRTAGLERLRALIDRCAELGTDLVTLCTGSRDEVMWRAHPDNASSEAWGDLVSTIGPATRAAESAGVVLAFEPEVATVVSSAPLARRLIDEIGSPSLKVVMDPANLFNTGELADMSDKLDEAFSLLGTHVALAHAKDLDRDGEAGHLAAGRGASTTRATSSASPTQASTAPSCCTS